MRPDSSSVVAISLGAAAVLIPIVYLPATFDFPLHARLFILQCLLIVGLLGWAIRAFEMGQTSCSPLTLPLIVYTGISLASITWSTNPVDGIVQGSRVFAFSFLALLAAHAISPRFIRAVYAAVGVAGAVVSLIGISQYFGWSIANKIPTVGNPSATFGYRNIAASYIVVAILPGAALAWTASTRRAQTAGFLSVALMGLFLIYTRTRGAWLGLAGSLFVGIFLLVWIRVRSGSDLIGLARSRTRLLLLTAALLVIGLGALLPHSMQREGKFRFDERKTDVVTTLSKTFSPSDSRGRLTVWGHTLEMVMDHPLLGVGLGSWQYEYPRYDRGDWITHNVAPQRPHNDLLWILSETGILGLAAYLWILLTLLKSVRNNIKNHPDSPQTTLILGISLGILALLGHSMFSFPRERPAPSMMFWMGLGLAVRLAQDRDSDPQPVSLQKPLLGATAALVGVVLICGVVLTYRQARFDAHYLQAHLAWRKEAWPSVASETGNALQWGPFNHRALLLRGIAYWKLNRSEDAVEAYGTSLKYHPHEGHGALAAAYADLGRVEEAASHYRVELDLYPRSAAAAYGLANALASKKDWPGASEAYLKIRQTRPDDLEARLGLADAYRHLELWTEAIALYRGILQTERATADIQIKLGSVLQAVGDLAGAIKAYSEAVSLSMEEDPRPYNNLGAVYALENRYGEAEKAYKKALELDPDYGRAYHNLGDLYAAQGKAKPAIRAYQEFIKRWTGDPRFVELAESKIQDLKDRP